MKNKFTQQLPKKSHFLNYTKFKSNTSFSLSFLGKEAWRASSEAEEAMPNFTSDNDNDP